MSNEFQIAHLFIQILVWKQSPVIDSVGYILMAVSWPFLFGSEILVVYYEKHLLINNLN